MASPGVIVPAQLGFLAIFNPSLGNTDETIDDQIVYYASVSTQSHNKRRQRSRGKPTENISQEERNERLRQIGLAQGMVEFGRSFSGGQAVDTIDTERSRVVVHELEPNWWILASIDLTRVPLPPKLPTGKTGEPVEVAVEYSTKEIKPASLLMHDLLRAHAMFLLHHDTSLSSLFVRSKRTKFVSVLSRYWDLFLSTWNVMLHGNPARNVFGGINIAASGELGIGVGEEERGSGEREVLEGLVGRIDGLVDLVVSKFGDHETVKDDKAGADDTNHQWLGTGREPGSEDGAIFLGTGALSRKSLKDVTHWMEDLYTWGDNAYGVIESPTSSREARKAKKATSDPQPVRPPMPSRDSGSSKSTKTLAERRGQEIGTVPEAKTPEPGTPPNVDASAANDDGDGHLDKLMTYMKLGYGTYWSIGKTGEPSAPGTEASGSVQRPKPKLDDGAGHYLIGLLGDIEESGGSDGEGSPGSGTDQLADGNSRTMLRTVHIELEDRPNNLSESKLVKDLSSLANEVTPLGPTESQTSTFETQDPNKATKLRVVVYVTRPFIFTFLFHLRTDSLALSPMYRSLHYQLAPLRKPLLASTAYRPQRPDVGLSSTGIYELIWDPTALTIHSTIPNIPEPAELQLPDAPRSQWSRAEATNTHMQMINIYTMTRSDIDELEHTCKTNRGWWVVWTRILDKPPVSRSSPPEFAEDDEYDNPTPGSEGVAGGAENSSTASTERVKGDESPKVPMVSKEIFLVRRASDHASSRSRSGSYGEALGWSDGIGKLAQGIGVDTRKYIEGLLSQDR